jgi:hypothetical protein
MSHYRTRDYRTERTMNEAMGPYAQLTVKPVKHIAKSWAWSIGTGLAVGAFLYLVVAIRAGL